MILIILMSKCEKFSKKDLKTIECLLTGIQMILLYPKASLYGGTVSLQLFTTKKKYTQSNNSIFQSRNNVQVS